MPGLKRCDEITEMDGAHEWTGINHASGFTRPITLLDFHARISDITLASATPEATTTHFDVARNLLVKKGRLNEQISCSPFLCRRRPGVH